MYPINPQPSLVNPSPGSGTVVKTSLLTQPPTIDNEPACFSKTISSTASDTPEVDLEKMKMWPKRISTVNAVGLTDIASKYPAEGEKLTKSLDKTLLVLDAAIKNLANDSDPSPTAIKNLLGQNTPEGINTSKSELLEVFNKVREEIGHLKNNSLTRLYLVSGRHVDDTLAAVKVDDPEKKMIITHRLLSSSSINQIQTFIHEAVHLVRHSDDYRYSPLKYDIDLTGRRINRENTERSLDDQQNVLAEMYRNPEQQFTRKNLADLKKGGGPKRSYSSMAREAGERPCSGTKICELAKNSEGFRRAIGLNNPDSIAALASAYGRDVLLHHEGAVEKADFRALTSDKETEIYEGRSAERAARRALREAEHQARLMELQHITERASQQIEDPDKMDIQTKRWLDSVITEEPHSDYSDQNLLHQEFAQLFIPCDPDNDLENNEFDKLTPQIMAERFSDTALLNPSFVKRYIPDQDDTDVYSAIEFQRSRENFLHTPTVSNALILIEHLQHTSPPIQQSTITDQALLKQLAKLTLLSDTSRGRGYGAEAAEPMRYVATLTRDLLRQGLLSPARTAQLWFGQAGCPAQTLLPVRLIPAIAQASKAVYVELMADVLGHPSLSQVQLQAIGAAVKNHLLALSKMPFLGTRDAHQRLLSEMADAGLRISKHRNWLFGSRVTVHATAPVNMPSAPANYLNTVDIDALHTSLGSHFDHLQALDARDSAGTSGVSARWRALQHDKEIRRLDANYNLEVIGERLESQNQWLADRSKFQKKTYAQEIRHQLAIDEEVASLHRRNRAEAWDFQRIQLIQAILAPVAEKGQAGNQLKAIESRAHRENTALGYSSVSYGTDRGLPSTSERLAVSDSATVAGSLTLPNSTFTPSYEISEKSVVIQALNRQGQPIRVEVPPPPVQGPGIIVNYHRGSSPSPLLSTAPGARAPTRYQPPVIDALYHHERSGLPVMTLKNARGDTFSAASFMGFTVHADQGKRTVTYNRVEPDIRAQQRIPQQTPAHSATLVPPGQDRANTSSSSTWGRDVMQMEREQAVIERRMREKNHLAQQTRETQVREEQRYYQQQRLAQRAEQMLMTIQHSQLQKDAVRNQRVAQLQGSSVSEPPGAQGKRA